MTVTASVLYDLVQCPQRVALDAFGDPRNRDEINAFVRLLWERGTLFERETIAKLQFPFLDLSKADEADRERLTLEAMARGEPLIYGGRIQCRGSARHARPVAQRDRRLCARRYQIRPG